MISVATDRVYSFSHRPREIAQEVVDIGQTIRWLKFLRKRILPHFECLTCRSLVAGYLKLILVHDRQALPLANEVLALVSQSCIFFRAFAFIEITVNPRKTDVG